MESAGGNSSTGVRTPVAGAPIVSGQNMGIQTCRIEPHWNYLIALDADLAALSRYVEFSDQNFNCFSIEMARVLLAAAAEVDVVCKQLCQKVNPTTSAKCINAYRIELAAAFPAIPKFKVLIPRFGLTLQPWDDWNKVNGVPFWWTAYNKVKHHRHTHYERASLENTLNAVAGLFVVVLHLYKEKAAVGELVPSPQLLRLEVERHGGMAIGGYDVGIAYDLDDRQQADGAYEARL